MTTLPTLSKGRPAFAVSLGIRYERLGRVMGVEPTTSRSTI
jgi:hypothetical protein